MYPIRKCKCGDEHECSRLDPRENGKLSAKARGSRTDLLDGPQGRPSLDTNRQFGPEAYERAHPELKPPRYDDGDGDHD
jgi:hypothetical protein